MLTRDESQRACGGRCCEAFYLSNRPAKLDVMYLNARASIIANEPPFDWETIAICEMIMRIDEDDESDARYTCRNLLPSGLCGIYATRPQLCRDYPGYGRGGTCDTCGFTPAIPIERRLTSGRIGLPVLDALS